MKKIALIIPLAKNKFIEYPETIKNQQDKIKIYKIMGDNPSKNRNNGVKNSREPLVAFINGHTLLDKDWAKNVVNYFNKNKKVDIVGGPQLTHNKEGFFAESSGAALQSIFGSANMFNRYKTSNKDLEGTEFNLTSANLICKREVFNKVKFDESTYPGEDPKFLRDAIKDGFIIKYSSKIKVFNSRRKSIMGLDKQIFSYGKTRAKSESLNQLIKKPFFLVPSAFLVYLILSPTLIVLNTLFSIPLLFYLFMNISFSIYESYKTKLKYLTLLPFIFLAIHLSYGAGFIYGKISRV
jgi:hypothetical protein